MSIERLNKAATAAGFAMATPDDEAPLESKSEAEVAASESRAMVVADPSSRLLSPDTASSITNMVRNYLSGFGWRQPA